MTEWHPTSEAPPAHVFRFETHGRHGQKGEARLLMWVKGGLEPVKGTCHAYPGRLSWRPDGHSGDWEVTDWALMPEPPQ